VHFLKGLRLFADRHRDRGHADGAEAPVAAKSEVIRTTETAYGCIEAGGSRAADAGGCQHRANALEVELHAAEERVTEFFILLDLGSIAREANARGIGDILPLHEEVEIAGDLVA
jgi:hypothetical protein